MKVLYLMHIDWYWIKQRPHFIAEYLNQKGIEVDIYCNRYQRNDLVKNESKNISVHSIPRIRGERFKIIKCLNTIIYFLFVMRLQKQYDYIFITHPTMYTKSIKNKLIYDCMDNNIAFNMSEKHKLFITSLEKEIIKKSEIVFFSSEYLRQTVYKRYDVKPKKDLVVNNAIHLPHEKPKAVKERMNKDEIDITYIGTISDWFDFDLLKDVQSKYGKKVNFNLYGPIDVSKKTVPDFVKLKGSIEHDKIFDVMNDSDVLMMPFVLNDLILSVNPVKLYEYIFSGKPILCVKYGETEKFSNQVYLYEAGDSDSFISLLNEIENNNFHGKISLEEAYLYVKNNTWEKRVDEMINCMSEK